MSKSHRKLSVTYIFMRLGHFKHFCKQYSHFTYCVCWSIWYWIFYLFLPIYILCSFSQKRCLSYQNITYSIKIYIHTIELNIFIDYILNNYWIIREKQIINNPKYRRFSCGGITSNYINFI